MAYYIEIYKIIEDADMAEYDFKGSGPNGSIGHGRLRIEKASGDVTVLECSATSLSSKLSERATWKLMMHWEKKEMPDSTIWAS